MCSMEVDGGLEHSTVFQTHYENGIGTSIGEFTQVQCGDVYAFTSASDSEYTTTDTFDSQTVYIGVEITHPNGTQEILKFNPKNIQNQHSYTSRASVLSELFNRGSVWIAEFDDVYSSGPFPKMRSTMVVPHKGDVDLVRLERDRGFTSLDTGGKRDYLLFGVFASIVLSSLSIGVLALSVHPVLAIGVGLLGFSLSINQDIIEFSDTVLTDKLQSVFDATWMNTVAYPDEDTVDSMGPLNNTDIVQNILCMNQNTGFITDVSYSQFGIDLCIETETTSFSCTMNKTQQNTETERWSSENSHEVRYNEVTIELDYLNSNVQDLPLRINPV